MERVFPGCLHCPSLASLVLRRVRAKVRQAVFPSLWMMPGAREQRRRESGDSERPVAQGFLLHSVSRPLPGMRSGPDPNSPSAQRQNEDGPIRGLGRGRAFRAGCVPTREGHGPRPAVSESDMEGLLSVSPSVLTVPTGPRSRRLQCLPGFSLGHIPAKVWIACLAAQGSLCSFRVHHGVTEGHRHPQASLGV